MILHINVFGEAIKCKLNVEKFASDLNQKALCLVDANTGEPISRFTVFIDDFIPNENEIMVKTWSECEWVHQLLTNYPDVFKDTGKRIQCGFAEAEVWIFNGDIT